MSFETFEQELDQAMRSGQANIIPTGAQPGFTAGGVLKDAQMRDVYKYGTNELDTWPSGDVKRQIVLTIQCEADPSDPDDDGMRSAYIKTWGTQKQALATAIRNAGSNKASEVLLPGAYFTITYKGEEQVQGKKNMFKQKVFEYEIIPPSKAELNQAMQQAPAPQAPAPQAPVLTTNPWNAPAPTTPAQVAAVGQQVDQAQQVLNLAANGMDPATIASALGLPADQVQQIINNSK